MARTGTFQGTASSADFWDFLPPVFVKELRQGLRANQFVWPFLIVQIAAILCVAVEYAVRHALGESGILGSAPAGGLFSVIFYVLLWIVFSLVLPLTQFGALQPELAKGRNVEILLLSNLSRWQIVLGKWFVGTVLGMLMLTSLIPYWLVRYLIGSIGDFGTEFLQIIGIVLINALMNAIVVGASGFRNYIARGFLIFLSAISCQLTQAAALGAMMASPSPNFVAIPFVMLLVTAQWIALSLQLGRAKLRLFESPLDPPGSAPIIVLIICSPILTGIISAFSGGHAGWIGNLLLLFLILMIDPGPGKKRATPYMQP